MKNVILGGGGFIEVILEFLIKRGDCHVTVADIKASIGIQFLKMKIHLSALALFQRTYQFFRVR